MTLSASQKAEVKAAMEQYASAYMKKDIRALEAVFSRDIRGYGSGADEIIRNFREFIAQIRRDWTQGTVHAVEFTDTEIDGDGRVAWVMTKSALTFSACGGPKQTMRGRSTMVLRNTGSRWVIEQLHFSMPFGGQGTGQSYPGA